MSFPKVVVFDLDYTLWPCWCDTHVSPPLKPTRSHSKITDRYGYDVGFYRDVPSILSDLKSNPDVLTVSASRTHAPKVAKEMLQMLCIDGESSFKFFDHMVWGTGSKKKHFAEIKALTGIDYSEMVFFDDEARNRDVEALGITFVLVDDGVTNSAFQQGVNLWRKRNGRA